MRIYKECFGIEVLDQNQSWVPHVICSACFQMLRRWDDSRYDPDFKFSTLTIWKKPMAEENCYFCQNDVKRLNRKNKRAFTYTDVSTVTKPKNDYKMS